MPATGASRSATGSPAAAPATGASRSATVASSAAIAPSAGTAASSTTRGREKYRPIANAASDAIKTPSPVK